MTARAFIIDRQSGGDGYAIQACSTLQEAVDAQRALEPVPTFPSRAWPDNWRFLIETTPDLAQRRAAEVAELAR